MKKKFTKILITALMISMVLSAPANMQKVAASVWVSESIKFMEEREGDEHSTEEDVPKDKLTGMQKMTVVWDGEMLLDISEEIPEDITETLQEETENEIQSASVEESTFEENTFEENTFDGGDSKCNAWFCLTITDNGELDYRKYMGSEECPEIGITLAKLGGGKIPLGRKMTDDELEILTGGSYVISLKNTEVVDIVGAQANSEQGWSREYRTNETQIPLTVNGVGTVEFEMNTTEDCKYKAVPYSGHITVNNSALHDDDFYITISGEDTSYDLQGLQEYLKEHNGWTNEDIEIMLSDSGKKYFSVIRTEERFDKKSGKKIYKFWAENPDRNASTKNVEEGTRTFEVSIDRTAPVCSRIFTDSKCFEPTKTDTVQYFAEDFVLKGTFRDAASGVSKVEYTTDYTNKENAVWHTAVQAESESKKLDFSITLQDGCYKALAVRCYDYAGNVSEPKGFVNDDGEFIEVVVDKSEPVMDINITSGGKNYSGDNDNWTNADMKFDIAIEKDSCPYAGLYKCEYVYDKIGEAVNRGDMTEISENWNELLIEDKASAELEVSQDRNGYYYFRAVSKSGIASKEIVKKRVLLQHQVTEMKPMIVNDVDGTKQKNGWYNKASGVPLIQFAYPDYDTGVISKEYDAPVTVHYKLSVEAASGVELSQEEENSINSLNVEKSAVMGILSSEDVIEEEGVKKFVLKKDDLDKYRIDFGYNKESKEAKDGIYTLEYWITDSAGNASEKQTQVYKIDSHEPTNLTIELEGSEFPVGQEMPIVYEKFYQTAISGKADAQYGISGKGSLKILRAKKINEWKETDSSSLETVEDSGSIVVQPNTRCFLYVKAEDGAGNIAEGWTRGIVVDDMAPNETNKSSLIIEPVGANRHGFFNDDVKVEVSVKDSPEDNNCAALMSVNSAVGRDGMDTIADQTLFSFLKEFPTDEELTKASVFESVQVVNAEENESNEAYIKVMATDRSGNTRTSTQSFKIDVTKPQVDISFDKNNGADNHFYNEVRTATIHVQELNFDPSAVDISVTKDGQQYAFQLSAWTSDGTDHYATIAFAEDGAYIVEAGCTDLADNESDIAKSEIFTIDRTAPELAIQINSGQDKVFHENYYHTAVSAVITVTEHNFSEDGFVLDMTPASGQGVWSHEGDVHTLRFELRDDNTYHIVCAYTDMAGNVAVSDSASGKVEKDFVIDKMAPIVFIDGVTDGSANNGAIYPVITVLDFNMEAQETAITVTTGTGEKVENTVETAAVDDGSGIGYRFSLTDLTDKEDNIYYLTVLARDKAGNESELTYRFSLNRKGSAYDLTGVMKLMERQYITCDELEDISIVEMNLDKIDDFEIFISRNGELGHSAAYSKEVKGSADTGYTYIYHVKKGNFTKEGTYRLSLYSKDRAGNEVNNTASINGKEISFIVDNTAPKVIFDGIETGKVYDVASQKVHVCVTDNLKLSEAELLLVNKENDIIERWNYMELADEDGQMEIVIPQYDGELSLLYRVKDAAGNEIQTFQGEPTALSNFLVTTDKFVQFIHKPSKTPFGRMVLWVMGVGIAAIAVFWAAVIAYRRRKETINGNID